MTTVSIPNILPSPYTPLTEKGFSLGSSGTKYGPGIKSLTVTSLQKKDIDYTHTGKSIRRFNGYHQWLVDITYNPMLWEDFQHIYSFLLEKRGSRSTFFVELPQYASQTITDTLYVNSSGYSAGATQLEVEDHATLAPGDFINVDYSDNHLQQKAYMITRTETTTDYTGTPPASGFKRIHISPGLARAIKPTDVLAIEYRNPKILVRQKEDVREYSLDEDNLYTFSLKLEEALY